MCKERTDGSTTEAPLSPGDVLRPDVIDASIRGLGPCRIAVSFGERTRGSSTLCHLEARGTCQTLLSLPL